MSDGQTLSTAVDMNDDGSEKVLPSVTIEHIVTPIDPNNNKYSVTEADVKKTIRMGDASTAHISFMPKDSGDFGEYGGYKTWERDAYWDNVEQKVIYSDWHVTTDTLPSEYTIKVDPGYIGHFDGFLTFDFNKVIHIVGPNKIIHNSTGRLSYENITADMLPKGESLIDIPANIWVEQMPAQASLDLVDSTGKVIKTLTADGKFTDTVNTNWTLPAGYKLADGQTLPSTVSLGHDGDSVDDSTGVVKIKLPSVTIEHIITPIDPNNNNHGVTDNDVDRLITRHVMLNGVEVDNQVAEFIRTASWDEVDQKVIYSDWNEASHELAAKNYADSANAGFKITNPDMPSLTVNPDSQDAIYNLTEERLDASVQVIYKDGDKVVGQQTFTGKTSDVINNPVYQIPAKYDVNQDLPQSITLPSDKTIGDSITIQVTPHLTEIDPSDNTHGVTPSDVGINRKRVITFVKDDQTINTVNQEVNYTRHAFWDDADQKVVYSAWVKNGNLDDVTVPVIDGYTAEIGTDIVTAVPGLDTSSAEATQKLTDVTTVVNYIKSSISGDPLVNTGDSDNFNNKSIKPVIIKGLNPLTESEKNEVMKNVQNVQDVDSHITNVVVKDDGTATVTFEDGTQTVISSDITTKRFDVDEPLVNTGDSDNFSHSSQTSSSASQTSSVSSSASQTSSVSSSASQTSNASSATSQTSSTTSQTLSASSHTVISHMRNIRRASKQSTVSVSQLPQTGEDTAIITSLLGLAGLISGFAIKRKKE